jgi:UDP-glucose 4-epimerase
MEVLDALTELLGYRPEFIEGDVNDGQLLDTLFQQYQFDAVIHFAAHKAVGESVEQPLMYYRNNVVGLVSLLESMQKAGCNRMVFSSSCTVYGEPESVPVKESTPTRPAASPYGATKQMAEVILKDNGWCSIQCLRYFNPVGAHQSGLIGENPVGIPNNLMPYVGQIALGALPMLKVFGNDYPTPDGTGLRDYIHVDDLARGHVLALSYLENNPGQLTVNLGTGKPYSVLEMIAAFEKVSGKKIPYEFSDRRSGDLAEYYANPSLAKKLLHWQAEHGIKRMCEDTWRFYQQVDLQHS